MNWHERMNRAIEYIESNLNGEINIENAAKIACQSISGFQKTFSIVTEMSVSEYIRKRRMSLAVYELQNSSARIIDIAMKYGYDSPDAFARTFKDIYGISPSLARSEDVPLKPFPRISFLLTIKGDVVMETRSNSAQIINMFYERMPALRLIGKRYTTADLDENNLFEEKWNDWFQNGWFNLLFSAGGLPGYENTAVAAFHNAGEWAMWIGGFFPEDITVPEGFSYVDIPAGIVGMSWIHGYRYNRELHVQAAVDMCVKKWKDAGNSIRMDFDGEICRWSFERYDNTRYFRPDNDGRVVLDYGIYLVESEISEQVLSSVGQAKQSLTVDNIEPDGLILPPEVRISGMAPFTVDAESNLLICAVTAIFLKLDNISESTPFFCARNKRICDICRDCGGMSTKSNLYKHHLSLYHFLLTATGIGLMVSDSNICGTYDLKAVHGITPPMLEDRLDFAMKAGGFAYTTLDRHTGQAEVYRQVSESIRQDKPVLMKFTDGPEWFVATGFTGKTGTLYGLYTASSYDEGFCSGDITQMKDGIYGITNWFRHLRKAFIVTGKTKKMSFFSIINRMIGVLNRTDVGVQSVIPELIDSLTVYEARGVAAYLNRVVGYVIESRWHAAEGIRQMSIHNEFSVSVKKLLDECSGICFNTHDTCWRIWNLLGVGPHTEYMLPNLITGLMLDKDRQEQLKQLFSQILDNDRKVLLKLGSVKGTET